MIEKCLKLVEDAHDGSKKTPVAVVAGMETILSASATDGVKTDHSEAAMTQFQMEAILEILAAKL